MLKLLRKLKRLLRKPVKWLYAKEVRLKVSQCGRNLSANRRCRVGKNVFLGTNVNFNGITIKGGANVTIGDNFHSGTDILIIPRFHNYDTGVAIPYDNTFIEKDVVIGDNVWVGDRVTILGGVTIEEGAIIQAGAVVVSDVSRCCIAGGSPAKTFKMRDVAHYEKLKALKRFK